MALTHEQMALASELVGTAPTLRDAAALWRARNPQSSAIVVDAMDMREETPTMQLGARRVYLVATSGHCWHVTTAPEQASGLVLTQD